MKVISHIVVFSVTFFLGAVTGSLLPAVVGEYPSIQPVDERPAQKTSCRFGYRK